MPERSDIQEQALSPSSHAPIIQRLPEKIWHEHHLRFLAFIQRYGEKRITRWTMKRLASDMSIVRDPEGGIWVAHDHGRILGLLAIQKAGIELSMIVVHPCYRRTGIGASLLETALRTTRRLYARISAENIPSLRLAMSTGFTIIDHRTTRNGQTIFILARGAWQEKEAQACAASVF